MLTGAMAPTEGYATVAGKDIRTQTQSIREDIGICLQHDCLFPQLTVREHVQFFSRVKGLYKEMSWEAAEEHIDQVIQDVALSEKRNSMSRNLSGGMKRKLSVAIAFCGGSKIVLLDEPTSGMDPFSRRFTWNVIRQYRQNRCIILTTHFMDEADILGDRIAIMAEGQLRCVGSSLFLKKKYGVGYQLTIEKNDKYVADAAVEVESTTPQLGGMHGNDDNLKQIVTSAVSEASLLSNVGAELSYQLPLGAASKFTTMFEGLDKEADIGRINSYGVSVTTLDEVFLLVARGTDSEKKDYASSRETGTVIADDAEKSARSRMDLENEALYLRHVGALFKKRAAIFRRDKKAWLCTTILPSLFVFLGFVILKFTSPERNLSPLLLNLESYNEDVDVSPTSRNPIVFNNPGDYTCQPGNCAYQTPEVEVEETNEKYYFCGYQARLGGVENCTIDESSEIIGRITGAGATPEPAEVTTVFEVRPDYVCWRKEDVVTRRSLPLHFLSHSLSSLRKASLILRRHSLPHNTVLSSTRTKMRVRSTTDHYTLRVLSKCAAATSATTRV
jgi:ATP-binding cassette subfamily A (ABC1) protein 3